MMTTKQYGFLFIILIVGTVNLRIFFEEAFRPFENEVLNNLFESAIGLIIFGILFFFGITSKDKDIKND